MNVYETGNSYKLNTTTELYVLATVQTVSKLHPVLMQIGKANDSDRLYEIIKDSLKKHVGLAQFGITSLRPKEPLKCADLAIFGITSTPLRILCYEHDNGKFVFSDNDNYCVFH